MRRRGGNKPTFFYCPKCGAKKLRSTIIIDISIPRHQCRRIWVCENTLAVDSDENSESYGESIACGAKIDVPGRDAEIEDYHSVLDRMVSSTPAVVSWLLSHDHEVCKTGIKCLFEGQHLDVVRYRRGASSFDSGIGIYMIPHFTRFSEKETSDLFRSAAADHILLGRHSVRRVFWQSRPMLYHSRKEASPHDGPLFPDKTESPELIKMILDWAADLDGRFVELQGKLAAARCTFDGADRELKNEIHSIAGKVLSVDSYDHVADRVHLKITGPVTRAQALAITAAIANLNEVASAGA